LSRHGHRFYLVRPLEVGANFTLPDDQSRQVGTVLRLAPGDRIALFNGDGFEYSAAIVGIRRSAVDVQVMQREPGIVIPPPALQMALALIKQDRFEWALQKVTELGVERVIPMTAERSVISFSVDRVAQRLQRWQRIVAEAAEQSGRATIPVVDPVANFPEVMADPSDRQAVVLWEDERAVGLPTLLDDARPLRLLVGPEGGFSPAEIALAHDCGALTASLGPLTLRAETAAVAAAAITLAHNMSQMNS
jgi:16S rRNA (uracil1498-N3)-methyltransferase